MKRNDLPIFAIEEALVTQLEKNNRAIVQAPTGSGKSTQIPQMLLDRGLLGDGQVVILQPRRLPTRMLAARVARERSSRLGADVGYQIRFEDVSSDRTRIKYETEGILLRQMLGNPTLDGVTAIIFDEFHERHLYGDITLARAMQIQRESRPDLKLLVMSATLAVETLGQYLDPCALLTSEGRTFPISIEYLPADHTGFRPAALRGNGGSNEPDPWDLAVEEFERLVSEGAEGDVLVFMPGAYEIHRTVQALRGSPAARDFLVLPLHGELPPSEQDAAVEQYPQRKIVVSTNVAESSLTIDGVRIVIDSGLARVARFDPYRGINTLLVEKISRASADQRAGRAGRTAPGRCVRLWTEREHMQRPPQELPEVKRLDLAETVLTLKASGIGDVKGFPWIEPPETRSLDRAELLLRDLGALDSRTGEITELGRRMLSFPVHPRYSRMLLAGADFGCVRSAALIAALTQGRNVVQHRQGRDVRDDRENMLGEEEDSDFFILMRAWSYANRNKFDVGRCRRLGINAQAARQVRPLFDYFLNIAREQGLPIEERAAENVAIQKCVLTGFSDQLAQRLDTGTLRCRLVHGRKGMLARDSVAQNHPLIVAGEVREIEGRGGDLNVLLTMVTGVKQEWLRELFPADFTEQDQVAWDAAAKKVVARRQVLFRDLVLEDGKPARPPEDQAAALLADEVLKGNLTIKAWDHSVDQWILRAGLLARWCPELGVPQIGPPELQKILRKVCLGSFSYKDIKDKPVWHAVKSALTGAQQALVEKHVPERLTLSNDRRAKITYSMDLPPHIAVRIQDLYGVKETPRIAMGRVPVVVHILAPNNRPVQVTQDLAGFWREHYPKVKQEMQRKYPKHEWR